MKKKKTLKTTDNTKVHTCLQQNKMKCEKYRKKPYRQTPTNIYTHKKNCTKHNDKYKNVEKTQKHNDIY